MRFEVAQGTIVIRSSRKGRKSSVLDARMTNVRDMAEGVFSALRSFKAGSVQISGGLSIHSHRHDLAASPNASPRNHFCCNSLTIQI